MRIFRSTPSTFRVFFRIGERQPPATCLRCPESQAPVQSSDQLLARVAFPTVTAANFDSCGAQAAPTDSANGGGRAPLLPAWLGWTSPINKATPPVKSSSAKQAGSVGQLIQSLRAVPSELPRKALYRKRGGADFDKLNQARRASATHISNPSNLLKDLR